MQPRMFIRSVDGLAVAKQAELAVRAAGLIAEFYNENHDEEGRFAPSPGGLSGNMEGDSERVFNDASDARSDYSEPERMAVEDYVGGGHGVTNRFLRNGEPSNISTYRQEDIDNVVTGMDSAFESHATPTNGITVFRGASFPNEHLKVGDIVQDKGYVSTTINKDEMSNFYKDEKNPVEMIIRTKNDTKSILGSPIEKELVLNRGLPLKINSIEHCPDGICRIDAEVW